MKNQPIFFVHEQWEPVRWSNRRMKDEGTGKENEKKRDRKAKWKNRWQMKDGPPSVEPFTQINCHKKQLDGDKRKSSRGMREKSNRDSRTGGL